MTEQGKFSRAMVKGKAAEKLTPQPGTVSSDATPRSDPLHGTSERLQKSAPVSQQSESFRRVKVRAAEFASDIVLLSDKGGEQASQIRSLRTKILATNNGHAPRVITVSSGGRQEGKSTVSFNLAVALSEIGAGRVILVDGDMLGPSLAEMAHIEVEKGLMDALAADLNLDDCIYETTVPNLDMLPTREIHSEESVEGLLHQSCEALLAKLRRFYAFVIIDTPPVRASSHAATFARHSDGAIVVARIEKTSRYVVKQAFDELDKAGARSLGCVLTHQRYHIPDFIYRLLFGSTPSKYYYRYGGYRRKPRAEDSADTTLRSSSLSRLPVVGQGSASEDAEE